MEAVGMESVSFYLNNISIFTYIVIFAGGVAASFTPCIYPLIPVIVGVIGSTREKSRVKNFILSLSYVLGMAITFAALGVIAAMTGRLFGQLQSTSLAHVIMGNIMILFGLVLLDAIHIPMSLLTRAGAGKVVKGGKILSALFMGLASGFVAAPCTAAILGALLTYVATTQNIFFGFSLLFTFAVGLGTVLIIVGTFTGVLVSMPASEKVMRLIQKIFAFGMILFGEYFIFRAGLLSL